MDVELLTINTEPPENLAAAADELYELQESKKKINRYIKQLDSRTAFLQKLLIDRLPDDQSRGIAGLKAFAQLDTDEIPIIKDWVVFKDWILTSGQLELLQKRLAVTRIKAILEEGGEDDNIPGVEMYQRFVVKVKRI